MAKSLETVTLCADNITYVSVKTGITEAVLIQRLIQAWRDNIVLMVTLEV